MCACGASAQEREEQWQLRADIKHFTLRAKHGESQREGPCGLVSGSVWQMCACGQCAGQTRAHIGRRSSIDPWGLAMVIGSDVQGGGRGTLAVAFVWQHTRLALVRVVSHGQQASKRARHAHRWHVQVQKATS